MVRPLARILVLFSLLLVAFGSPAASHPVFYPWEAEDLPRTSGSSVSDATASGGRAWSTTAEGSISTPWFAEHSGSYKIAFTGRGVPAAGVHPHVTVFTDGRAIGHFVMTSTYQRYQVEDTVDAGTKTLRILFSNPGAAGGATRTLLVDTADVELSANEQPRPIWREAEAFSTSTTGAAFSDARASEGQAWNLWANGHLRTTFSVVSPTTFRMSIWARADLPDATPALLQVRLDDSVLTTFEVRNSATWAEYRTNFSVAQGSHTFDIAFINDLYGPGGDRNLRVDALKLLPIGTGEPPTSTTQRHEVETFPTRSNGGVFSDPSASAGKGWNQWSNGVAQITLSVPETQEVEFAIRARGSMAADEWPEMELRIDGATVATWEVMGGDYTMYSHAQVVPAGARSIGIAYTNDARTSTQDRNLYLDHLDVRLGSAATTPPPPTGSPSSYEVERFPRLSDGGVYSDAAASAGKGWKQWSNGVAEMTLSVPSAQTVQFSVRAKGSVLGGAWPVMELRIGGATRTSWTVASTEYGTYTFAAPLAAGSHTIGLAFTNDARSSTQDRNLYLDRLDVSAGSSGGSPTPPPPPPPSSSPVRYEAESFPTRQNGGVFGDASASGGKMWNQWSIGQISMPLSLSSAQRMEFSVRAKGSVAKDIWPLMDLRIDDEVVGHWTVSSTSWSTFKATKDLAAGSHTVAIGYINDGSSGSEDRNLYSDYLEVRVLGASEAQPPAPLPGTTAPETGKSQWPQGAFDVRGSRFNKYETSIGASNAARLVTAWSYSTPRSVFSSPAVVDGIVYFGDSAGTAYAVNANTGALVWKNSDISGGISNNLAVAEGKVFHGKAAGEVVARNAATGAILWRVKPDPNPQAYIWSSPVYHAGKLYIGVASTQESAGFTRTPDFRGSFVRIDAGTGTVDWQFYIVPSGYTGGAMWSTAALDPDARTVYFGTGNAYTAPAHARTDAIIALNMDTGALKWSTQGYANDVWTASNQEGPDTDFAMPVLLWNTTGGDKMAGAGNKVGDFFGLDHDTGAVTFRVHPQRVGQGFFGPGAFAYGRLYGTLDGDKSVIAMHPDTGAVLWRAPVTAGFTGGVAVSNGAVFAATHDGAVWAFDAITGRQLWKGQVPGPEGAVFGSPSIADGKLLVPFFKSSWSTGTGGVVAFKVS